MILLICGVKKKKKDKQNKMKTDSDTENKGIASRREVSKEVGKIDKRD